MKKKQGFALICPFQDYIHQKEDFFRQHPKIKILEEIKTLTLGAVQLNDVKIPGINLQVPQQVVMILWAIVFEEEVPEEKKLLTIQ